MKRFIQMFPGCHGVEFVLAMSAFSGSIPFSHNVTMLVYRHSFESRAIEAAIRRSSICLKQERCVVGFVMTQFAVVFVNVDCYRIMEHEK